LYICGTLYCVRFSHEEFPFLLYGMYSLKEPPQETYTTYSIEVDGKQIDHTKLLDARRELMITPLINFASELADSNSVNDEGRLEFETWLWHYVINEKKSAKSIIEVYKNTCVYNSAGRAEIANKERLFRYGEQ
jgi:hypothetical protein